MMRVEADEGRREPGRQRSLLNSDTVALLLLVLLAFALIASEAEAGEPEPGIDRAALLADFRADSRPGVSAAASEVLGEIRAAALDGPAAAKDALRAADVEPSPVTEGDEEAVYAEASDTEAGIEDVVASNDESLRF